MALPTSARTGRGGTISYADVTTGPQQWVVADCKAERHDGCSLVCGEMQASGVALRAIVRDACDTQSAPCLPQLYRVHQLPGRAISPLSQ